MLCTDVSPPINAEQTTANLPHSVRWKFTLGSFTGASNNDGMNSELERALILNIYYIKSMYSMFKNKLKKLFP